MLSLNNSKGNLSISSFRIALAVITISGIILTRILTNVIFEPKSNEVLFILFATGYNIFIWVIIFNYYKIIEKHLKLWSYSKTFSLQIVIAILTRIILIYFFIDIANVFWNSNIDIFIGILTYLREAAFNVFVLVTLYITVLFKQNQKFEAKIFSNTNKQIDVKETNEYFGVYLPVIK